MGSGIGPTKGRGGKKIAYGITADRIQIEVPNIAKTGVTYNTTAHCTPNKVFIVKDDTQNCHITYCRGAHRATSSYF